MSKRQFWAHVSDLEPVAEHVAPPVVSEQPSATQTRPEETAPVVSPQVGHLVHRGGEMSRDKVKVTAVVTVTLQLELTQPWSQGVGMDEIHKQAKDSARGALGVILGTKDAKGVNARITHDIGKVRIITEDV